MRLIGLAAVLTISVVIAPLAAGAQQAEKVRRIGFLAGRTGSSLTTPCGRASASTATSTARTCALSGDSQTAGPIGSPVSSPSSSALNVEVIVAVAPDCALYRLTATCACRVVFERWVTAEDAATDLFVSQLLIESPDASSVGRRVRRPSLSVVFAISITASAIRWAVKGRASPAAGV